MDNFASSVCPIKITGIQDFLIECQPKLQKVFNNCGFHNTEGSLALLNEQTVRQLALLEEKSKRLIGKECSDFLTSSEDAGIHSDYYNIYNHFVTEVKLYIYTDYDGASNFSRTNELPVLTSKNFISTLRTQLSSALM